MNKRAVSHELPYNYGNRKELKKDSLPYNIGNRNQERLPVTKQAKREYVNEQRIRYRSAMKTEQGALLDEMVRVTRYNRKYLIRALGKTASSGNSRAGSKPASSVVIKAGRPPSYHAPELTQFLCYYWHATNQACAKRLQAVLPQWLQWYEKATGIRLSLLHQVLLTRMTHTTIDRLLAEERSHYRIGKGRASTKPGTLFKKNIPIKTDQWHEKRPGFLEIDTVAHCGTSLSGLFVYSLNTVDIGSGWVEPRGCMGKRRIERPRGISID